MKLLFITQKLHDQDVFAILWVRAFQACGYEVTVVCLEKQRQDYPGFTVLSLGKEYGTKKWQQVFAFERIILSRRYDRVFIHMTPVWAVFGLPWWVMRRVPVYCWYTHYQMQLGVQLLKIFGKRFFCATPQSLPQYDGSPKKVVVGHGIDLSFWMKRKNQCKNPHRLLVVHRLSRSKRLELTLRAVAALPREYTLDIYGIEAEPDYTAEMKKLANSLQLHTRVTFHGTVPMESLPEIYVRHRLILNMASQTIDKTMLEAMTCGCYPVTTKANARAIGLLNAPDDIPTSIAAFTRQYAGKVPMSDDDMFDIVEQHHSLEKLIGKMDEYIARGI